MLKLSKDRQHSMPLFRAWSTSLQACVSVEDAENRKDLICADCLRLAEKNVHMSFVKGDKRRVSHFSHRAGRGGVRCKDAWDDAKEGPMKRRDARMSAPHYLWGHVMCTALDKDSEVMVQKRRQQHIADLQSSKFGYVIFQAHALTPAQVVEKERFFETMVWLWFQSCPEEEPQLEGAVHPVYCVSPDGDISREGKSVEVCRFLHHLYSGGEDPYHAVQAWAAHYRPARLRALRGHLDGFLANLALRISETTSSKHTWLEAQSVAADSSPQGEEDPKRDVCTVGDVYAHLREQRGSDQKLERWERQVVRGLLVTWLQREEMLPTPASVVGDPVQENESPHEAQDAPHQTPETDSASSAPCSTGMEATKAEVGPTEEADVQDSAAVNGAEDERSNSIME